MNVEKAIQNLKAFLAEKPEGYFESVIADAVESGDQGLEFFASVCGEPFLVDSFEIKLDQRTDIGTYQSSTVSEMFSGYCAADSNELALAA